MRCRRCLTLVYINSPRIKLVSLHVIPLEVSEPVYDVLFLFSDISIGRTLF